ncbi:lipopolysaccharide biosynthesis protein [Bacillus sp. ISL-46]|uniref:lipopolysaccharide biosynthesis protein n=1 Tax=Bacillus sp. ISL-46 TaxID=2819129 RepID=UPI001BE779F7|nr:lipopolysaccharide biosynthesis protein [Bacillus sp. ISL-46]MBT2724009.1 lipopolysaccharide biosynthesis protein [Bacillus sp. ISL-46]
MSREKVFIKNTLIYTIGNLSSKILVFLLLPLYTHYLSTNEYGYIDIIITTISLFLPIVTFQITDGLFRFLLESEDEHQKTSIISSSFKIVFRNLLFVDIIYLILINFIKIELAILIMIYFNVLIFNSLYLQISRGLRKNLIYAIAGIISTLVNLCSNIVLIIFLDFKINGIIISMILSNIAAIIYIEKKLKISSYIKFNLSSPSLKKEIIIYSLPLIPNVINWWVMNASDRFFLNLFIGMEANGIYALANKFPSILIILNSIFNLAWQESAITEYKSKDRDEYYSKMFNYFLRFQIASLLILLSATPIIFKFLIDKSFADAYLYMPALYISAMFSAFSSFYGTGFQSSKDTKGAFYSSIFGSIINIIFNIILIPIIGIHGATISTAISFGSMWVIRIFQTKKYFKIKIDINFLIKSHLLLVVFVFLYYTKNISISYVSFFFSLLIFIYLNKSLLLNKVKGIKLKNK